MRDRGQIEMTVGEYHDARRAERQRILAQLEAELRRAREAQPDWYVWIVKRRAGEHAHGLKRADGSPSCCPVDGCDVVGVLG